MNRVSRIKSRRNSSCNQPVFYFARLVVNHHKRLSKWRQPICSNPKKGAELSDETAFIHTTVSIHSSLAREHAIHKQGKQLQVTLQVYHYNSVSVFIQFLCCGEHPEVEHTYQSCTEDVVNAGERSEEFNDLSGHFCTVSELCELVVCSVGLSELRGWTNWAFDDAYFAFTHVCHICCSSVLVALGISHRSLHHTLSTVYLQPCAVQRWLWVYL